jgi:hypothetical protein
MNRGSVFLAICMGMGFVFGCSPGPTEQELMQATVNAAVQRTQTVVAQLITPTPLPSPIPTETPDPGELIPEDFRVSLPSSTWVTYNVSGEGVNIAKAMLYLGLQENPALQCAVSKENVSSLLGSGLRLIATKATTAPNRCVNLIILALAPVQNIMLEELAQAKVDQLKVTLAGKPEIKQNVWQLNHVKAAEIIYEQTSEAKGDETYVHYMVLGPKGIYLATFVTPTDEFRVNYADFTQIMQSFALNE